VAGVAPAGGGDPREPEAVRSRWRPSPARWREGNVATIRRHLEALTHDDAVLYRALGRAALELAQKRGMDEATAAQVAAALATDVPPVIRKSVDNQ